MATISEEHKKALLKVQATLLAIEAKRPVFFNISAYQRLGLVKEFGRTIDNKTNWILTEKGKRVLDAHIEQIEVQA
jgi:hypothetical protein